MEGSETERLNDALVTAFPRYLERRFRELGIAVDDAVAAAVEAGREQLRVGLDDLMSRPADEQAESPLELVRRATAPVTELLAARGTIAADRDPWQVEAHPEDRYDLYPASSRELGEEVWRLHLEWGVHKAAVVARVVPAANQEVVLPAVALFGVPLERQGPLQDAIESRGFRVVIWRNPAALAEAARVRPVLVLVDLGHPEAHRTIRELAGQGIRVVAIGESVDDLTLPGIMALGAEEAVASGRLLSHLDELLPSRA